MTKNKRKKTIRKEKNKNFIRNNIVTDPLLTTAICLNHYFALNYLKFQTEILRNNGRNVKNINRLTHHQAVRGAQLKYLEIINEIMHSILFTFLFIYLFVLKDLLHFFSVC